MHTSQQSSKVVVPAAVADSDASAMPVHVFVLAAVAAVVDPRLYGGTPYERRQNG